MRQARANVMLAAALGAALLSACSLYPDHPIDEVSACEVAVSRLPDGYDVQSVDLSTFEACRSVDEWTAAAAGYSDGAMTQTEARSLLSRICERDDLRTEAICIELTL